MSTLTMIACAAACVVLFIFACLFIKPLKQLFLLILHSVLGWAGLYILNNLFAFTGFSIGLNLASASIAGVLGGPGLVLLILTKLIY